MWCDQCQQDVPAVAMESGEGFQCARCNNVLQASFENIVDSEQKKELEHESELTFNFDTWRLQQDLDRVDQLLGSIGSSESKPQISETDQYLSEARTRRTLSLDESHNRNQLTKSAKLPDNKMKGAWFSWLSLALGCMTLASGAVMIAWSIIAVRPELWNLGIPLTILGQAGLLLSVVLQMDGLWHNHKETEAYLQQVEAEIQQIQHTTNLICGSHSQGSRSFYLHMAEGASPHLLLSDLKGQIDMLAVQLAQEQQKR